MSPKGSLRSYRFPILAVALASLGLSAFAAPQQTLIQAYKEACQALAEGRYLDAADMLRPLAMDGRGKIIDPTAFQLWNQFQIDLSGEPYRDAAKIVRESDPDIDRKLAGATAERAIASIVDRAKTTRIVILNEDHVHPRQRAFALEVAKALKPLGYNVLALEALDNSGDSAARMAALKSRGYVILSDGLYTRDPVFADFIRQAMRFGYEPVSYEDNRRHDGTGDDRAAAREQAQAENLAAILKSQPAAKLFIYVGASHLAEAPLDNGNGKMLWMAARLAKLSGINPLTVDQTTLESGCGVCMRLSPLSSGPVTYFRGSESVVAGQYSGAVDLQVFKPTRAPFAGRPGWYGMMDRRPVPVPSNLLPKRGRRLVQAFIASEGRDAIPIDQFVVIAERHRADFMLPKEKVRFAVQDPSTKGRSAAKGSREWGAIK